MPLLLLAFIVVPLIELYVISEVATWIGLPETILVLFLDSVIGAVLVRREGSRAWQAFRRALAQGRWPGDEVVQGALILVGGALLLTPGFVTDVVGLLAVVPPTRAAISRLIRRRVREGPIRTFRNFPGFGGDGGDDDGGRGDRGGGALDVEVLSIEPDRPRPDERGDPGDGGSGQPRSEGNRRHDG